MSEVEKTARSSETPEAAVPSAPEPHPASGNSLAAVGNVRTLQDVQRDIQDENVTLLRFRGKYDNALSACDDARTASRREPTNTSLSEDLADARESRDGYKRLMDNSEKRLEKLGAELARLQAAANASSGQKNPSRHTHKPCNPDYSRLQPDSKGEIPLNLEAKIEPIPCGFIEEEPRALTDEAAVPSAPEAHPASGNSPAAVVSVRTLQDVRRDIQKENVRLDQAREGFQAALSAYDAARTATTREPTNTTLSQNLANAKESKDGYERLLDISEKRLERLEAELAQLQAYADASKNPSRHTHKPYIPDYSRLQPESKGEIDLDLEAEIEPIPCGFIEKEPPALTDKQEAVIQWNRTAYDFSLSNAVINFLRNEIDGDLNSERSFLSRNDCFLDIIRIIAAKGTRYSMMGRTRDDNTPSSRIGPDVTIYEAGYPELVVIAEQAVGGVGAESEICDKFVFLPHYAELDRIVGIAIIGNQFKIGYIHRDPKHFEVIMNLTTGEDGNGYTLAQAAVNIGIWFRATMARDVLYPLPFRFGVPSVNAHRHLRIHRSVFEKMLLPHDDIDLEALSEFYKSIRSQPIPYFEYPLNDEGKSNSVVVTNHALFLDLKPVGLERQPRTSDELKDCLVCILTALQDLHGRGYVHLDLRWPNVVIVAQREWFIIDGEYVRKSGDPYPQNLLIRAGDVAHYSADLTMLGKMLGALDDPRLLTSNVQALIEYLIKGERSRRTAGEALQLVQGW